jgi:putative PIN family toxin of toxin-antitoxin system
MIRVVIDTNVVVSALLFEGVSSELSPLWKNGQIKPLVSKRIIGEYIAVFAYPKFKLTEEEISYLLYKEILPFVDVIIPESAPDIVLDDPSDDKFIHCAVSGDAKYIVSGDRHLLSLGHYGGVQILSPSKLISITARSSV